MAAFRALVITPTYNERDNLRDFVKSVRETLPEIEILVVDDNSPDGTGAIADELAAVDAKLFALHRAGKLGLGSAYLEGFRWGLARGYDVLIEMDTDHSHDPQYLPQFLAELERGADVVVGSRNIEGGGVK